LVAEASTHITAQAQTEGSIVLCQSEANPAKKSQEQEQARISEHDILR
jgi:hypothetical protein